MMVDRPYRRRQQPDDLATRLLVGLGRSIISLLMLPFRNRTRAKFDQNRYRDAWQDIRSLAAGSSEAHWHQAIIQADKLVDQALREIQAPGDTFGDRLKASEGRFGHDIYNHLWQAHKVRNQIAHETNFYVDRQDTEQALDGFERALSRLGAL
jgi:hypothetical protein